jgi:hypothetical protein
MIRYSTGWPAFARLCTAIAPKTVAHHVKHCGYLLVLSARHVYNTHEEKIQMRLAPTKPRSWRDVRRAAVSRRHTD